MLSFPTPPLLRLIGALRGLMGCFGRLAALLTRQKAAVSTVVARVHIQNLVLHRLSERILDLIRRDLAAGKQRLHIGIRKLVTKVLRDVRLVVNRVADRIAAPIDVVVQDALVGVLRIAVGRASFQRNRAAAAKDFLSRIVDATSLGELRDLDIAVRNRHKAVRRRVEGHVAALSFPRDAVMDRDKVLGLAYWGTIDYLGESMGWPVKGWNQGVFDLSLQPKPDAYFVKSMFSEEPVVHIGIIEKSGGNIQWNGINVSAGKLSENWNREVGEKVSLYTYTNADEVELFLNGKSLGVRKNSEAPKLRARIKWDDIAYAPGVLLAVARKNGKVVARHQIETTGEAVALKLVPDIETWHADGKDLMHVRIYAVDKKGRRVLNVKDAKAFDKLTFTVKGDANIVAVDNGNIASDELHIGKTQLEKSIQRHLFQGSALVILRAGDKPGKIELSVAGEKMKAKKLVLNTK